MPHIKILIESRPEQSTWVDDDHWETLTPGERQALIRGFVRRWYPPHPGSTPPKFKWEVI